MAQDATITEAGDLAVTADGDVPMVEDAQEVAQCARIALNMAKGNWVLDPDEGLDQTVLFRKKMNKQLITAAIQDTLLQDPRITGVTVESLETDSNRQLTANISIEVNGQYVPLRTNLGDIYA